MRVFLSPSTHHRPRVGDARRLQQHRVKGLPRRARTPLQLLERLHQVGAEGAADAAPLQGDDVLLGDQVGRDWRKEREERGGVRSSC
jgi:hypothetical protein